MTSSPTKTFLACHDCGLLQPIASAAADEVAAAFAEAHAEFVERHAAHRLGWLTRLGTDTYADRPLWDPMSGTSFEASDGDRIYVVTTTRAAIDAPRVYHFRPGGLEVNTRVQLDAQDLRRGLDLEFFPHALRPTKLDRFLSVLREVIRQITPDELTIAFDAADDPSVSVAPLPDERYRELVTRCADIFDPGELPRVSKFLQDNREADGLLALRVRREVAPR